MIEKKRLKKRYLKVPVELYKRFEKENSSIKVYAKSDNTKIY